VGQAAGTGEFPNVTVKAAGICPSSKQEPVWRADHMLKPGPHRLQNPALPFDTLRSDAAHLSPLNAAPEFGAVISAHIRKKSVRCTKMKTDKIVAIGLKRLKTVLCHCGITDKERTSCADRALHKTEIETGTSRRIAKRGMKC
jgi:hypothetical protein